MEIKRQLSHLMRRAGIGSLPSGTALLDEARRYGLSEADISKAGPGGEAVLDEPKLQRRVLAARADWRSEIVSVFQTLGIIGAMAVSMWGLHIQSVQKSAELMLSFNDRLYSNGSALVMKALDRDGNLNSASIGDEEVEDFLDKYELLASAYRYRLINRDMAYGAFSYDLETALKDPKVRRFLAQARTGGTNFYEGVLKLARSFGIDVSAIAGSSSNLLEGNDPRIK